MRVVKRVICLANSRKRSGRCIAGKQLEPPGCWVRPVSGRPSSEVSEEERSYRDGSDPRVLDVIDIPLLVHLPKSYQPENWLLDPSTYWKRIGRATQADLTGLLDQPPSLWTNGNSSLDGCNDRVLLSDGAPISSSLYLLHVHNLTLRVSTASGGSPESRRRVQAQFSYQNVPHRLSVTDPAITREYLAQNDGVYPISGCYVTLSLSEPFHEHYYKLVAAIIRPDRDQASSL